MDIQWLSGRLKTREKDKAHSFIVEEYKATQEGQTVIQQYKVQFIENGSEDRDETTWLRSDEVELFSHHALIQIGRELLSPWMERLYSLREEGKTGWEEDQKPQKSELTKPEQMFQNVLARYANKPFYAREDESDYYEGYAWYGIPAGTIALDALADISIYRGQYRQAIRYLEQLAQQFPDTSAVINIPGQWSIGGPAAGVATLKIADIHAADLHDPPGLPGGPELGRADELPPRRDDHLAAPAVPVQVLALAEMVPELVRRLEAEAPAELEHQSPS